MPRLLSVNSYHYRRGGSDAVYFDHADLLQSQGWSNAFFSMHHPRNVDSSWSRFFIDELEFGGNYGLIAKVVMASKVIYSFEAQRKLRALLAEFPADIAHLHCIYHHHSPSILSTLAEAGVPTVMTAHDLKIACPSYKMFNDTGVCERCKDGSLMNVVKHRCIRGSRAASLVVAAESALHRSLDSYRKYVAKVVVPSRFFMQKFVEWGWPEDKFELIPNFVDAGRFEPSFDAGEYFLYFGRLAPEKGVETLLRAAKIAKVKLLLAGTGPEEANLQRLNAELGGGAKFLGFQAGAALHDLVRGSCATVLPSEWYENAPMSVLESYALGKPVLGARIGGIPELVVENETGWCFESRNVEQLAALLDHVGRLPTQAAEEIGRRARSHVEENFNRARYLNATLGLYAGLGVAA